MLAHTGFWKIGPEAKLKGVAKAKGLFPEPLYLMKG